MPNRIPSCVQLTAKTQARTQSISIGVGLTGAIRTAWPNRINKPTAFQAAYAGSIPVSRSIPFFHLGPLRRAVASNSRPKPSLGGEL
jgi:hypothetical protein